MKIPLISWVGFDFIVDLSCYTSVRMCNVFAGHSMNCFKCTSLLDSCGICSFLDWFPSSLRSVQCSVLLGLLHFRRYVIFRQASPTTMLFSSIPQQVRSYWIFDGVPFRISLAEKILLRSCSKEMSFAFQLMSMRAFSRTVAFYSRLISPQNFLHNEKEISEVPEWSWILWKDIALQLQLEKDSASQTTTWFPRAGKVQHTLW